MSRISVAVMGSLLLGSLVAAVDISCPGVAYAYGDSSTGCCVGGTIAPPLLSTCAGWPICTGPVTTTTTATPISCATIIPYTASAAAAYTSQVDEASKSIAASGTVFVTTLNDAAASAVETDAASGTDGSDSGDATGTADSGTGNASASNGSDSTPTTAPTSASSPASSPAGSSTGGSSGSSAGSSLLVPMMALTAAASFLGMILL